MIIEVCLMECPICKAKINIPSDVLDGEIIECESCGVELEVKISKSNISLKLVNVEEDWGE